jgi:rhodanese-related sulfurtransferase
LRLSRVGYDNCIGYLKGGFEAWAAEGREVDTVATISVEDFVDKFSKDNTLKAMDVRRKSEYDSEHVVGIENAPLDFLNNYMASIDRDATTYVHCAGGYRSMIAISILKARGFENLVDVSGGFSAIKATNKLKLTDYVCPSTLL